MLWLLSVGVFVAAALLTGAWIVFNEVFAVPKKNPLDPHETLPGPQYDPHRAELSRFVDTVLRIPYEDVWITSSDGLKLHGRSYFVAQDAPVELLFHGYRSTALRDFCGGLQLALESGHNVLLVDQRAHGQSEGKCLTFGIKERQDCLDWIHYLIKRYGKDVKIMLMGMSMGASTVLMASGLELPANVCGIIADCGYTSPREIICKVMRERHLPPALLYPLVRLSAKLFGGFNPDACSTESELKKCRVPVLFIHGEDDRFVPCEMSRRGYAACVSDKVLLTVPDAGHALSFMMDARSYIAAIKNFWEMVLKK